MKNFPQDSSGSSLEILLILGEKKKKKLNGSIIFLISTSCTTISVTSTFTLPAREFEEKKFYLILITLYNAGKCMCYENEGNDYVQNEKKKKMVFFDLRKYIVTLTLERGKGKVGLSPNK
uniref:Uncharacterized protein n=1 Tax=Glossina pallidipes TaxID=7398 RepID=A0A1B0A3Z1_GLOPL